MPETAAIDQSDLYQKLLPSFEKIACVQDELYIYAPAPGMVDLDVNRAKALYFDATGAEMFYNEIPLDAQGDFAAHPLRALWMGGVSLAHYLSRRYPQEKFVVIAMCADNTPLLRFHKKRQGESWLAEDLDLYEEVVFAFET